jgi:hypothetical protein
MLLTALESCCKWYDANISARAIVLSSNALQQAVVAGKNEMSCRKAKVVDIHPQCHTARKAFHLDRFSAPQAPLLRDTLPLFLFRCPRGSKMEVGAQTPRDNGILAFIFNSPKSRLCLL